MATNQKIRIHAFVRNVNMYHPPKYVIDALPPVELWLQRCFSQSEASVVTMATGDFFLVNIETLDQGLHTSINDFYMKL